jgi:hypothetical protein
MTEACAFIIGPPIGKNILSSNQIKDYLENGVKKKNFFSKILIKTKKKRI